MKVEFLDSFYRDLENQFQPQVKSHLIKTITAIEEAVTMNKFPNLKKLSGYKFVYRIRLGDYRLGLFIENDIVQIARFAHRKDIYKLFP
jgi:mRNA interferase RelE/StbE